MIDRARMTILTVAALSAGVMLVGAIGRSSGAAPVADNAPGKVGARWDKQAAARYLDSREAWWKGWDHSDRDHGTKCVSCHTQAPYALARPLLRGALGETDLSASEKIMLADVEKRVRAWDSMLPFYSDEKYGEGKEIESRFWAPSIKEYPGTKPMCDAIAASR